MKIYISGASGLVGSAVVKRLKSSGHFVYSTKYDLLYSNELAQLTEYLRDYSVDLIIHCAGKVGGIKANSEDNQGFQDANWRMGRNLIDVAKEAGVKYFINLASSCAYPINTTYPLTESNFMSEDNEYEPTNEGYAVAKQSVANHAIRKFGKRAITLIPCNMYGENDRYFEGSHIIPDLIQKFHKAKTEGVKTMTLYGTGQQYREFMYAGDLAEVIVKLVNRASFDFFFQEYLLNVRTAYEISTMELATRVAATVGWSGTIKWSGELSGIKRKPMNITKLHRHGLRPISTTLADGLVKAYKDYLWRFINV